jgi:hypothetical protein
MTFLVKDYSRTREAARGFERPFMPLTLAAASLPDAGTMDRSEAESAVRSARDANRADANRAAMGGGEEKPTDLPGRRAAA